MSRRHNTSRRRTYGRRQHELHERVERQADRRNERAWRVGQHVGLDGLTYDGRTVEAPLGFND